MSLPTLTKNEKLILASVIVVLLLFWSVVGWYVWIKVETTKKETEQVSRAENPLSFLEKITPVSKNLITPQILPPNPQISTYEVVKLDDW